MGIMIMQRTNRMEDQAMPQVHSVHSEQGATLMKRQLFGQPWKCQGAHRQECRESVKSVQACQAIVSIAGSGD